MLSLNYEYPLRFNHSTTLVATFIVSIYYLDSLISESKYQSIRGWLAAAPESYRFFFFVRITTFILSIMTA
jgi:hypothetical protein